jgi:glutathione S-transferase
MKGLDETARPTTHLPRHLRKGEQCMADFLAKNPQGFVPALKSEAGDLLTQSLAIIEWLDETHPEPPLWPKDPLRRAMVRAFAQVQLKSIGSTAFIRSSRGQGCAVGCVVNAKV